jgi:uncharacterized YccA/Bax inhibitor family protein
MMRTSNPALNERAFGGLRSDSIDAMTVNGTVHKTAALLFLVVCGAAYTWNMGRTGGNVGPWLAFGGIGGFIAALATIFKKEWSPITAPIYSVLEGLFLGGISAMYANRYEGIVLQAVMLTFGTLGTLLAAYRSGFIRVTDKFRSGVVAATGAIFLVYMLGMILSFFGTRIPLIHESGVIGIGFSLLVVGIAAMNLVLDFDLIEQGAHYGAPKYMEWYAAFGLMVTLVWLYLEMLRLLSKMRER